MTPPNRSIVYRVSRNGHVMGDFDIDRIVELLDSGEFLWTDLFWRAGASGWEPLSSLRPEIAAAKAFPPVTSAQSAVSGSRRMPPRGQSVVPLAASQSSSGRRWMVGGALLGGLIGLAVNQMFPNIVHVERPVEVVRTVEKPVEVIRTVEKLVEVPAKLTPEQNAALRFSERLFTPSERQVGVSLFKLSDRVKVVGLLEGKGAKWLSESLIIARVETALRQQGFRVLSRDSKEYPYTLVKVSGVFLEELGSYGSLLSVSGSYELSLSQPVVYFSMHDQSDLEKTPIKVGYIKLHERGGTLNYGVSNLLRVTDVFQRVAEEVASDLRKAQDN